MCHRSIRANRTGIRPGTVAGRPSGFCLLDERSGGKTEAGKLPVRMSALGQKQSFPCNGIFPRTLRAGAAARRLTLLFFLLLLGLIAPAQAAVTIAFYSSDMHVGLFNIQFPHGFVVLNGMTDAGVPVDANYGFTATIVTPAIMFGPVDGEIIGAKPSYIADARSHFSLTLSDDQYQAVTALMAAWRDTPQPSYNLNGHNCMTFVKAMAVAVGLEVSAAPRFMREPSDFLDDVAARNPVIYAAAMPDRSRMGIPSDRMTACLSRGVVGYFPGTCSEGTNP
jgi:hypothetical protein